VEKVFEQTKQKNTKFKNRLIRSAQKDSCILPDGSIPRDVYILYEKLAAGGIGTIITGASWCRLFDPSNKSGLFRADNWDVLYQYKKLAEICKQNNTVAIMQLTYPALQSQSTEDIELLIEDFIQGACFAKEAGFDGVQIHEAHKTFLSELLSANNQREDIYGQDKDLAGEKIVKGIREKLGNDFLIWIKINCDTETKEDALRHLKRLEKAGLDLVEVSGKNGTIRPGKQYGYFRNEAAYLKENLSIPVSLVGGMRMLDLMNEVMSEDKIDFISMARALNCEPDLPNKWKEGNKRTSDCLGCNGCINSYCLSCLIKEGAK
jgi:2,4-dienoyl-CoA reductase-like NADH-dependent reductase (Old Yellow Enzyme family)